MFLLCYFTNIFLDLNSIIFFHTYILHSYVNFPIFPKVVAHSWYSYLFFQNAMGFFLFFTLLFFIIQRIYQNNFFRTKNCYLPYFTYNLKFAYSSFIQYFNILYHFICEQSKCFKKLISHPSLNLFTLHHKIFSQNVLSIKMY